MDSDLQRARIDEDIQQHRLAIRNLHSRRNTLAPISRLPNELLASIFIRLARDHFLYHARLPHHTNEDEDGSTHFTFHPLAWSQVSTHWRNVALDCAIVWSYIFATSLRWIKVLLKRSCRVPLKIRVAREEQLNFWLRPPLEFAVHIDCIEEFIFSTNWQGVAIYRVFAMLLSCVPHLRVLQLSMKPMKPDTSISDGDMITVLWHLSGLHSLTSLVLASIPLSIRYDLRDLRNTLSCMPNLEHLCLENALASTCDFMEFNALQKIELPCLARLWVTAPATTVFAFLSSVNTPVYMQAKLKCEREDDPPHDFDYSQLCHLLARHYSIDRLQTLPTIRLVAMSCMPYEVAVAFCTSLEYNHGLPSDHSYPEDFEWDRNVLLEIVFRSTSVSWMQDVLDICTSIPNTNRARALHVFYPPSCQTFWKKLLRHFSRLRRMKFIEGDMPNGLVSVLRPQPSDRPMEDWKTLVPRLNKLEVVDMEFRTIVESDSEAGSDAGSDAGSESSTDDSMVYAQSLYDALSSRPGQGRLTMTGCNIKDDIYDWDMAGRWGGGRFRVISERRLHNAVEVAPWMLDSD